MKSKIFLAMLLASAAPVAAQDTLTAGSASDANAVSGSQSGSQSDNNSHNTNNNGNAGIGNSGSTSGSNASASTSSGASSNGNQQGQQSSNSNSLGATNSQGVQVSTTFNTTSRKNTRQEFRTNAAVPLAASSSFSSDYCGGTASGGASVAPLGVSIGGAGPTFDNSCRYLRVAEKAGMLGANYYNMQQPDMAGRAMSMMAWAVCMAGPQQDKQRRGNVDNVTMEACLRLGLLGSDMSPSSPPAVYQTPQEVTPLETQKPNVEPLPDQYKTPRGELEYKNVPVIQNLSHADVPLAAAVPPARP